MSSPPPPSAPAPASPAPRRIPCIIAASPRAILPRPRHPERRHRRRQHESDPAPPRELPPPNSQIAGPPAPPAEARRPRCVATQTDAPAGQGSSGAGRDRARRLEARDGTDGQPRQTLGGGQMSRRFKAAGFTAAEMLVASAIAGSRRRHRGADHLHRDPRAAPVYPGRHVHAAQRRAGQLLSRPDRHLRELRRSRPTSAPSPRRSPCAKNSSSISPRPSVSTASRATAETTTPSGPPASRRPPAGTNLDTPDAFRTYLGTLYSAAPTTFVSYPQFPRDRALPLDLRPRAIPTTPPPSPSPRSMTWTWSRPRIPLSAAVVGNYVSVRRYVNGALTAYYDCCFKLSGDGTDSWYPAVVSFERQSRKAVAEGSSSIDRFKIAEEKPFCLVFWPDPSRSSLKLPNGNTTGSYNASFSSTDPRKAYNHMGGPHRLHVRRAPLPLHLMNTLFHRSRSRRRGAAMLVVLAFTIIGGIAVTAWTYLLAARAIQASRMSDSVVRHITWGNNTAINQQYNLTYAYRDNVTQPELIATVTGGGGEVAGRLRPASAPSPPTNNYSNPASSAAPFNNIRKQITADNSVYYTRTTATIGRFADGAPALLQLPEDLPARAAGRPPDRLCQAFGRRQHLHHRQPQGERPRPHLRQHGGRLPGWRPTNASTSPRRAPTRRMDSSDTTTLLPQNFPSMPDLHRRLGGHRHRRGARRLAQHAQQLELHA